MMTSLLLVCLCALTVWGVLRLHAALCLIMRHLEAIHAALLAQTAQAEADAEERRQRVATLQALRGSGRDLLQARLQARASRE